MLYDAQAIPESPPLKGVDKHHRLACGGHLRLRGPPPHRRARHRDPQPKGEIARFLTATGPAHTGSELCGAVFDPSGTRLYFSSQTELGGGAIYEVTGPFRTRAPADPPGRPTARRSASGRSAPRRPTPWRLPTSAACRHCQPCLRADRATPVRAVALHPQGPRRVGRDLRGRDRLGGPDREARRPPTGRLEGAEALPPGRGNQAPAAADGGPVPAHAGSRSSAHAQGAPVGARHAQGRGQGPGG